MAVGGNDMPRIGVGKDERYPDYFTTQDSGYPEIEVTDEELAFIKRADEEYGKAQLILGRAYPSRKKP